MNKRKVTREHESWPLRMAAELGITFIDLKRDFGLKLAFGTPGHEDLLLLLLKGLLPDKHIRSVTLGSQEQEPDREDARGGIYDIQCETDDGSSMIIEMQVCPQPDFNDRMVFYSSFPIRNRVGQGVLKKYGEQLYGQYRLPPIYTIGILDFELLEVDKSDRVIRHFSIREDEDCNTQFTDSIHYITVELPKFRKEPGDITTLQDIMLYSIKNMGQMKEIPKEFLGKGLEKLYNTCSFANMTEDMQMTYVRRMMAEKDRRGQIVYARAEGEAIGRAEGEAQKGAAVAKALKAKGIAVDIISECTGLTQEQIEAL